jgi:hypothetical protein
VTQKYRGPGGEQSAVSVFLRNRWLYGSVLVLDLDQYICSPDLKRGLMIEWKHVDAVDRTWTMTRRIARRLNWWSALFVYQTDTGRHYGEVIWIDAILLSPAGGRWHRLPKMDFAWFDQWVCDVLGAKPRT